MAWVPLSCSPGRRLRSKELTVTGAKAGGGRGGLGRIFKEALILSCYSWARTSLKVSTSLIFAG